MLRAGDYEIKINPDSTIPETQEVRQQKISFIYDRMRDNPLINNYNLTKLFLSEMGTVSFEDILLEQQPISPQPMNMGQYANRLTNQQQLIGAS